MYFNTKWYAQLYVSVTFVHHPCLANAALIPRYMEFVVACQFCGDGDVVTILVVIVQVKELGVPSEGFIQPLIGVVQEAMALRIMD